jgi:hypothetical protein
LEVEDTALEGKVESNVASVHIDGKVTVAAVGLEEVELAGVGGEAGMDAVALGLSKDGAVAGDSDDLQCALEDGVLVAEAAKENKKI